MSSVTLYRASGLALLLGAVLFIVGSILSFAGAPLTPVVGHDRGQSIPKN